MRKYQNLLLVVLSLLLFNSATSDPLLSKEKKYLPKEFKKVRFTMSLADLKKVRKGDLQDVSNPDYDFRKEYKEEIKRNGIDNVTYYLDNSGVMPLYEMIIVFESAEARDAAAKKLLGPPNYEDDKWKIDAGMFYPLYAWTFQNKLVYAIPMDGSEWEEGLE